MKTWSSIPLHPSLVAGYQPKSSRIKPSGSLMSQPMETAAVSRPPPADDAAPSPKRRKLRKGTVSCWECKRRKAKCTFSNRCQDICEGCRRRGTDCISQEVADEPPSPRSKRHLVDRLGSVEASVRQLLQAGWSSNATISVPGVSPDERPKAHPAQDGLSRASHGASQIVRSANRPEAERRRSPDRSTDSSSQSHAPPLAESWPKLSQDKDGRGTHIYDSVSRELLAAWPSSGDMAIITKMPLESSESVRAVTGTSPDETGETAPSSQTLLQLPEPGSHPILIGRKMITLALILQTIPPSTADQLNDNLSASCDDTMSRLVKKARDLVTRDDDLVSSAEGLECLLLEGLYENHLGNLRRSWLLTRRAVMIAQMLGVNRGVVPRSENGDSVKPEDLWFRIISFDRYLCLMLGLSPSSPNEDFTRGDVLAAYPANTRLQRLCSDASGLLMNRTSDGMYDEDLTARIDEILQESSTSMPATWWVSPGISPDDGVAGAVRVTLRANDHLMQYHLLLQLHFPYLLRPCIGNIWDYHKMTAVTASREVLTRFLNMHKAPKTRYYCRGIDLLAFFSCTALALTYILCRDRHDTRRGKTSYFLTHQRLSDRGLLEQAMSIAEEGVRLHDDNILRRLADLLRCLFAFEDDVVAGHRYTAMFVPDVAKQQDLGHQVRVSEDGRTASIHLPHFPVVKIERQDSPDTRCATQLFANNSVLDESLDDALADTILPPGLDGSYSNIASSNGGLLAWDAHCPLQPWLAGGADASLLETL